MSYLPPDPTIIAALLDTVNFNEDGLITALAQSAEAPHDVLMLAWMNREALAETLATGQVCYYSRSRNTLWRKGESSGQRQKLVSARLDCDRDAVLLLVEQTGVACHTGRRSCFYHEVVPEGLRDTTAPEISPEQLYGGAH
ncbi:phosphoribosyl-AMP cyclohydrolase [Asaia krungthepensis]|uniref:Phosphoribosyl-AMP cyclohydrolase n=1 Tax=Asaia krungthepensis NRIC 0535 TaxID=1307925 RepID=A0ABQ0PYA4_9PROT|nr:phosphoribosyl-AMP cyclohydrolase [Asaia krungthepensis]GBQ84589.1 phosphoribosyl-AMP cyclohydrolase [Asaia krungthepensis NRIC 0535]